jgi:hypothetical protein
MKQRLVSAVAMLFCAAILMIVAVFGYSRYKESQVQNAEFREQLQEGAQNPQGSLGAHMPAQLPTQIGEGEATPTPAGQ